MDNLNDIKKIWQSANTAGLPNADETVRLVKKYRANKLVKKLAVIIAGMILTAIMVMVVFNYRSTMLATRIGEVCLIVAGMFVIITNTGSISKLYGYNDYSNKEFIAFLEQTRIRQIQYYKKAQVAGLVCASIGLLFYIYERVYKDRLLTIITYAILIVYLLVMWLVVRPMAFKRRTKKLDETINRLKELSKQF